MALEFAFDATNTVLSRQSLVLRGRPVWVSSPVSGYVLEPVSIR